MDTTENPTPAGGTAIPQDQTSAPETSQGAGQENAQKPVTQADLEAFASTIIKRVQQSSRDRNRQVEAELKTIRTRLDGTGVQISQEQEQVLRGKIADDLTQAEEPQASGESQPALTPDAQYVYDQINAAMKKTGQIVTPNHPEYKEIADALADPNGSLADTILAANSAAQKLAARLATNQAQAGNRISTGGASTAARDTAPTTAKKLWGDAYNT